MNVICKARHFCLWSSDSDKTFLSKTSGAIWFSAQIWSKSPVTPSILKTPTFLRLSSLSSIYFQRSEHSGVHAAGQQPDQSHTAGDQDSEGGGESKLIQVLKFLFLSKVDNPLHLLDVGQEAIVLSGLNKHASESLKNIKNLYDETKYLKTYLEKLEAKVL